MSYVTPDYDDEEGDEGEDAESAYVKWLAAIAPKRKRAETSNRTVNIGTRTTIVHSRHYSVFGGSRDY